MVKLKILIVEDDDNSATLLSDLLREDANSFVGTITLANSWKTALAILSEAQDFDLTILDKNLGDGSSFDLIKAFEKHRFGLVTFMTQSDIPADIIERAGPVLQIVKPFGKAQIANFISKVKKLKNDNDSSEKIGISIDHGESMVVLLSDVFCIESIGHKSKFFYFEKEKNRCCSVISNEEFGRVLNRLPNEQFIQCHRSYIVNHKHIKLVRRNPGGKGGTIVFDHPTCEVAHYSDSYKEQLGKKINTTV